MTTGMPELGSKISLISKADIRYEGRLFTVDPQECTIALASVRSFGTEDRETQYPVPAQNQVYDYILFRGSDIKDIRVINNVAHPQPLNDPAIMQLSVPPSLGGQPFQGHPVLGPMAPQMGQFAGPYGGMGAMGGLGSAMGGMPRDSRGLGGAGKPSELLVGPGPQAPSVMSPPIEPPLAVNHHASVLDLIGGSRSTTPASIASRKSPTNDQGVQAGGSKQDDKKVVKPIQPPGQRNAPRRKSKERRPSREEGQQQSRPSTNRNNQNYQGGQGGYQSREHGQGGYQAREHGQGGYQAREQRQGGYQGREHGQGGYQGREHGQGGYQGREHGQGGYQGREHGQGGYQAREQGQGGYQAREQGQGGYQNYQGNQGGGQRGGWVNRGAPPMRPRGRPRGGYRNQPNGQAGGGRQRNTLKFENDYDFEQANTEFEELKNQLGKLKVDEVSSVSTKSEVNGDVDKKDDSGNETGAGEPELEDEHEVFYDKTKSFFDKISCEAVERAKGKSQRTDWRVERKLNSETFGVSATRRGSYRGRGGYRGMGYRGGYRTYRQPQRRDQQQQQQQQSSQNQQGNRSEPNQKQKSANGEKDASVSVKQMALIADVVASSSDSIPKPPSQPPSKNIGISEPDVSVY